MNIDAITKYLDHHLGVREARAARGHIGDGTDRGSSTERLLAACPHCHGAGFKETNSSPLTRTPCLECAAAGRVPTRFAIQVLQLVAHASTPHPAADAHPEAIAAFNHREEQKHAREAAENAKRAESYRRAEAVRDLLAGADPAKLEQLLTHAQPKAATVRK